jgi:hypothetical protein
METPRAFSRETGFNGPKPYLSLIMDAYDDEHLPGTKCFIMRLYYVASASAQTPGK